MYENTNITNNLDIAMLIFVKLNSKPVDDNKGKYGCTTYHVVPSRKFIAKTLSLLDDLYTRKLSLCLFQNHF